MAKAPFDYNAAMLAIRGKVGFDFDLSKELTPAQKGRIKRAFNDLAQNKNQRFIRPRKLKGESDKQHERRISKLRRAHGQDDLPSVRGIFINEPTGDAKISISGDEVRVDGVNRLGDRVREIHIPFPNKTPGEIFEEYPDAEVWLSFHGHRSKGFFINEEDALAFLDFLDDKYGEEIAGHITGWIVQIDEEA